MSRNSLTEKEYHCWIVKWTWLGDHRRPDPLCHLLPYRWGNRQVRDYVKALYVNSECVDSLSALALLKDRKFWNSRLKDDGCLITTSTNPALEAHRVTDLTVEYNGKERKEILRWTRPTYYDYVKYSTGSRPEPIGKPVYTHAPCAARGMCVDRTPVKSISNQTTMFWSRMDVAITALSPNLSSGALERQATPPPRSALFPRIVFIRRGGTL